MILFIFNTGLVVQYTNNNGITWHLLRELDYMSYLEPQIVSIDLPREAKTSATAFRWWQPQHGKQCFTKNLISSFPIKQTSSLPVLGNKVKGYGHFILGKTKQKMYYAYTAITGQFWLLAYL